MPVSSSLACDVSRRRKASATAHAAESAPKSKNVITNGPIIIDDDSKAVEVDGKAINLTPTEYSILKFLAENAGTVYSPKDIYKNVWNADPLGMENAVLVHIRHIREKIEILPAQPRYIISVFGYGYKMEKMN